MNYKDDINKMLNSLAAKMRADTGDADIDAAIQLKSFLSFVKELDEYLNSETPSAEPDRTAEEIARDLTDIIEWNLPATGKFWDEEKTRPTSYETEYGSNGAREYMRAKARKILAAMSSYKSLDRSQEVAGDWIRVEDRLPEHEPEEAMEVIALYNNSIEGLQTICSSFYNGIFYLLADWNHKQLKSDVINNVIQWQNLPAPPVNPTS